MSETLTTIQRRRGNNDRVDTAKTIDFFINGAPCTAFAGESVIQAAVRAGVDIPHFCWHHDLSVPGNCRICMVEVEQEGGDPWFDIGCNMPVTAGMRVLTESERVLQLRRDTMQFITLNHPVDCGICNKSGECLLQDYHYEHNGRASLSRDQKNHATKFFPLSKRIMLDNERCIMCTRCVRFTDEVSQSRALAAVYRGDHALIRPAEDADFDRDVYSDNVVDVCPVGALLAVQDMDNARVWYTEATPSVCPGCSRGCRVNVWHRKPEWALKALDPHLNARIERVTPIENEAVNGPWICNKARDLSQLMERPRVTQATVSGRVVDAKDAIAAAAAMLAGARRVVVLVSSWGSNEEFAAFASTMAPALGGNLTAVVKADHVPQPGEVVEDHLLILADKNPNRAGALTVAQPHAGALPGDADVVLVWGEGAPAASLPSAARVVRLASFVAVDEGADVVVPISTHLERSGSFTNATGVVSTFQAAFAPPTGVAHAADVFTQLATAMQPGARA